MKMTIIIKFDSDESDENDSVADEARYHTINRRQLLKLFFLLDTDQSSEGRSVSMENLYNRVAIGNDQKFDHHILESADHLSGTTKKEMHQ